MSEDDKKKKLMEDTVLSGSTKKKSFFSFGSKKDSDNKKSKKNDAPKASNKSSSDKKSSYSEKRTVVHKDPEKAFQGLMEMYAINQFSPQSKNEVKKSLSRKKSAKRGREEIRNRLNLLSDKIDNFFDASLKQVSDLFKKVMVDLSFRNTGKNGKPVAYVSNAMSKNKRKVPLKSVSEEWNTIATKAYSREERAKPENAFEGQRKNLMAQISIALRGFQGSVADWSSMKTTISPLMEKVLGGPVGYTISHGRGYFGRVSYNNEKPLECLSTKEKTRIQLMENMVNNGKRKPIEKILASFGAKNVADLTNSEIMEHCRKMVNIKIPANKMDIATMFGPNYAKSDDSGLLLSRKIKNNINSKIDHMLQTQYVINEKMTPMTPILYKDTNCIPSDIVGPHFNAANMTRKLGDFGDYWKKLYESINPNKKDSSAEIIDFNVARFEKEKEELKDVNSFGSVAVDEKLSVPVQTIRLQVDEIRNLQDLKNVSILQETGSELSMSPMSDITKLPEGNYKLIDSPDSVNDHYGILEITPDAYIVKNELGIEHNIDGPSKFTKDGKPLGWAIDGVSYDEDQFKSYIKTLSDIHENSLNQQRTRMDNTYVPETPVDNNSMSGQETPDDGYQINFNQGASTRTFGGVDLSDNQTIDTGLDSVAVEVPVNSNGEVAKKINYDIHEKKVKEQERRKEEKERKDREREADMQAQNIVAASGMTR